MFGLATILEALVGPLFRWITLPLIVGGLLTTSHLWVESWKGRLIRQGEVICDGKWESKIRDEEKAKGAQALAASRLVLEAEQSTNRELSDDNERLEGQLQGLLSDSNGDASCLSKRVLDALRNAKR